MKKQKTKQIAPFTASEFGYVQACWDQMYSDVYPDFFDYLCIAIRHKEICGTVYN
jgi:hypothetical protein